MDCSRDIVARPGTVKVIIISGRAGSGKTSVSNELHARISQNRIPHVCLEGDSLDEIYPKESDAGIFLTNLSTMWQNFARLCGSTRLLINGTGVVLEAEAICKTLEEASKVVTGESMAVEKRAFVLSSSDEAVEERLRSRETDLTLNQHLRSSSKMAAVLSELRRDWLEFIETDGQSVSQVADQIIESSIEWFRS
jgi:tRNA uridine 5-carbamoylmethylation protein Kti12